jgi:predicted GIY-YIG superfamily endonuclease
MRGGWVYIMTNHPNGTLYTGVTGDLARRAYAHREGLYEGLHQAVRADAVGVVRAPQGHHIGDPAREQHEALAARLEGA